jgi:hypothetical protein
MLRDVTQKRFLGLMVLLALVPLEVGRRRCRTRRWAGSGAPSTAWLCSSTCRCWPWSCGDRS